MLFNRVSSQKIDLTGWLTARAIIPGSGKKETSIRQITPTLHALALKHFPFSRDEDADCRETITDEDY